MPADSRPDYVDSPYLVLKLSHLLQSQHKMHFCICLELQFDDTLVVQPD